MLEKAFDEYINAVGAMDCCRLDGSALTPLRVRLTREALVDFFCLSRAVGIKQDLMASFTWRTSGAAAAARTADIVAGADKVAGS